MKYRYILIIISFSLFFLFLVRAFAKPPLTKIESLKLETGPCNKKGEIVISSVYSPYSIHTIKAEISGTIKKINGVEGQILKAHIPIVELDCEGFKEELKRLKNILNDLKNARRIQEKNLNLMKKKYERYLHLFKKGHIEKQALEDIEAAYNKSNLLVIDNSRQQEEISRAIIATKEKLKKCAPAFDKDLYVSENFKELFDTVVPGESLSRLLDISLAKIHLSLPLSCFKRIKDKILKSKNNLEITIISDKGEQFKTKAKVEKLKIDTDNDYLYSYGFDLAFKPIKGLLFGEVVTVKIAP